MRSYGWTDLTKLMVVFRKFANAPKIIAVCSENLRNTICVCVCGGDGTFEMLNVVVCDVITGF